MLGLTPILFVLAWWWALGRYPWRERAVALCLAAGLALTLITELCGFAHCVDAPHLAFGWGVAALVGGLFATRSWIRCDALPQTPLLTSGRGMLWLSLGAALLLCMLLFSALTVPPNNWDSMSYHLPRVMHWQQNRAVGAYPTPTMSQVWSAPFAEYAILQLQILLGTDRAAALVQWGALIGISLICSLCAARLGAAPLGQGLAAFAALTLPEALLQGSSTQTDLVAALFMCSFVYYLLDWQRNPSGSAVWGMALALALALCSKGTAWFYCAGFGVWMGLSLLRKWRWRALVALALIVSLFLLVNGPFLWRTYALTGGFLPGKEGSLDLRNEVIGWGALVSNLLRNAALHLVWPWNGPPNELLTRLIRQVHQRCGLDMNDPKTTWPGTEFYAAFSVPHEDTAANVLHSALFVAAGLFVLLRCWRRDRWIFLCYGACWCAGIALFCGLLKWQPWHSRLHAGWFLMGMPLLGVLLERLRRPWLIAVCSGLFISALYTVLWNQSRAWVGPRSIFNTSRAEQFYYNRPELLRRYYEACTWVRAHHVQTLGLLISPNEWEYPLWHELRGRHSTPLRMEHILVANQSASLEHDDPRWANFTPDFIMDTRDGAEEQVSYHERNYRVCYAGKGIKIFESVPPAARPPPAPAAGLAR